MSFTIKCDACGHTFKFRTGRHRYNHRQGDPIIIFTDTKDDLPEWLVMRCTRCGHRTDEIQLEVDNGDRER